MAKFYGRIGYVESIETEPGIWEDKVIEKPYAGDLNRINSRFESSGNVLDNIILANVISIVADPYAMEHFYAISYVIFEMPTLGGVWKVSTAEVNYPRITLTIGGVYNGPTVRTSVST